MKYVCDIHRHLVCIPYSKENLHKMAEDLGIKRCWFHKNHYDIPKRRILEISLLCEVVSSKEILRIIKNEIYLS
jgi:FMN phosphatase YigB (HAD superfamily)